MLAIYCLERVPASEESALVRRGRYYARATGRPDGNCVVYRDVIVERTQERPDFNRMGLDIADGKIDEVLEVRVGQLFLNAEEKRTFESLCLGKEVKLSYSNQVNNLRFLQDFRGNTALRAVRERLLQLPWTDMLCLIVVNSGHRLEFSYEFSHAYGSIGTAKYIDSDLYDYHHHARHEYHCKRGITLDELLTEIESRVKESTA